MIAVAQVCFGVIVAVFFLMIALIGWFESKARWNDGVCPESQHPWTVEVLEGHFLLDDGHGHRESLNFFMIHPAIGRAYRRQQRRPVSM